MNQMTPSGQPEPSPARPVRPATRGEVRRLLQDVFPDLDPDVVAEVLEVTSGKEGEE